MVTGFTTVLGVAPPWREGVIQTTVVVVAVGLLWFLLNRAAGRLIRRTTDRSARVGSLHEVERAQRITTLWALARILILVVLLTALGLLALSVWGVPITPFLAVGSVVGVAVGFGAQSLVKDVIAGVFIVAEDQYGLGDVVQLGEVSGKVEAIRLRTTVLRDLDGYVHHVPNGFIDVASNFTQEYGQAVVDVNVAYESDIDRVLEVVGEEASRLREDPDWEAEFLDDPEVLGIEELAASSIRLRLMFKVRPMSRWNVRREFLRRIKARFDAEGIVIPFPQLSVITPGTASPLEGPAPPVEEDRAEEDRAEEDSQEE